MLDTITGRQQDSDAGTCCLTTPDTDLLLEVDRIREVFGLADDAPLPQSSIGAILKYHEYLSNRLSFPFQALYFGETEPPVRHLVHYITVLGLHEPRGSASRGIRCEVAGVPGVGELPLVEIGVRDDNPNYQIVDDYAYWLNSW